MLKRSTLGAVCTIALALAIGRESRADDAGTSRRITFYEDVLPIMQTNCQDCHRPAGLNLGGMIAPMPLVSYEDVRPWAKSIASVVKSGEMPPWHAARELHGRFKNERALSDEEIQTVFRWATTGAARGDQTQAPAPMKWPESGWSIGKPDLILSLAKPYFVKDDIEDININLMAELTPEMLPEDKYITAIEYRPDTDAVHHIIGFTRPPRGADAQGLQMIGGMAPGTQPTTYPEGYGVKLHAGSKFIFQMHYHKEAGPGTGKWDQSQVAFRFADKPVNRVFFEAIGDISKMYVPAGAKNHRITSTRDFTRDITILSYLPHMHLRGTYSKYTAKYPDGTEKVLLEVPEYDFNWQTSYELEDFDLIPAGTTIEVVMGYDNSAEKFGNPDPTVDVSWGDATTDEMNLGWFRWAYTHPGEDDVIPRAIGGGNGRR